jgi:hypothetical protein
MKLPLGLPVPPGMLQGWAPEKMAGFDAVVVHVVSAAWNPEPETLTVVPAGPVFGVKMTNGPVVTVKVA